MSDLSGSRYFLVLTDFDPQTLNQVSLMVFERWVKFAMGKESLQGYQLHHPTGRYASSISRKSQGPYKVAIIADEKMAPEGIFLEEGHDAVDLKEHLVGGRSYPMHRGTPGSYGSKGYGPPILGRTKGDRRANVWAKPRAAGFSGYARVPTETTPENADSWVIPPMPAYAPAGNLVELLRRRAFG